MGCDIHLWVELQSKYSGNWEPYPSMTGFNGEDNRLTFWNADWWIERNYSLFSLLANVRNYRDPRIVPIDTPRGLPPDINEHTRLWIEDSGAEHSFSWLTLNEVAPRVRELEYAEDFKALCENLAGLSVIHKVNFRFVFGFDS